MNSLWSAFGYLLGLCVEMVLYMVVAIWIGRYFNENHPLSWSWINVTLPVSLLLCLFSIYRFFVMLIKKEDKKA